MEGCNITKAVSGRRGACVTRGRGTCARGRLGRRSRPRGEPHHTHSSHTAARAHDRDHDTVALDSDAAVLLPTLNSSAEM